MFHDGDLQSGISRAITEGKLVACFMRSENEESTRWQDEWLPSISTLGNKAVLLRIESGSQEASFLDAFCPITTAPTLVVIDKGRVLEKLEGGIERADFDGKIRAVLGIEAAQTEQSAGHEQQENTAEPEVDEESELQEAIARSQEPAEPSHPASAQSSASNPPAPQNMPPQPDLSSMLPDRASKHEEEKAKREAAEKAERIARAEARRKEAEEAHEYHMGKGKGKAKATTEASEKEKARRDWLVQQKQRKDEAKRDRERILAQIEADKRNRKARSQQAKEEVASSSPLAPSAEAASRRTMGAGGTCSLVIRLFDGSSVKNRFEPSTTLATGVRNWINETTSTSPENKDIPYTFKQILAPLPSRSISITEENDTLASLGLTPTATLVLVPVQGYTDAYSGGGRGYMSTALHAAYNVAGTASNVAGYFLSYIPGFGGPSPSSEGSVAAGPTPAVGPVDNNAGSGSIRVRSLADQRKDDRSTEFYNGNSSAFEGRKDDDQGDDK